MTSLYSPNLRIELIGTGEQAGTWGSTTNTNLGTLIESAISGYQPVTVTSASQYLTASNGAADQSRNMVIELQPDGVFNADFTIAIPPAEKYYVIKNSTTKKATIAVSQYPNQASPLTGGTTVDVPASQTMILFSDATNVAAGITYVKTLSADTLTLATPLSAASGGLPTQTNFASCFLTTDGTTAAWGTVGIKTVLVATTAALPYPFSGLQAPDGIDGVNPLAVGNRVLVKDQGAGNESQNGIWVVASGNWTRAKDADTDLELAGVIVNVQAGTLNGGKQFATSFKATDGNINANTWASIEPLPSQTNSAYQFLTTNGTVASWASPASKIVAYTTTANLTSLSGTPGSGIDGGVTLTTGDRILVKNQTTTSQNGIYVVNTSGSWARAADANSAEEIAGSIVIVQRGTTFGGTQWTTTFKSTDTLDSPTLGLMPWSALVTTATAGGVTTFSGGTTGLTPNTATPGAITLAGTLGVANGGTGATTLTGIVKGNGTGAFTTAVSGTDFKTINSNSILGSGNISIATGLTSVTINTNTGSGLSGGGTGSTFTLSNTGALSIKGQSSDTAKTGAVLLDSLESFGKSLGAATNTDGYQMFPGGLIINWGYVPSSAGSGPSVSFTKPYVTACFNVSLTCIVLGDTGGVLDDFPVVASAPSLTGFTLSQNTGKNGTYWIAIGK